MGTSNSVEVFAGKLAAFARAAADADEEGVARGALVMTTAARASIAAAAGGDSILSGMGKGAKVGARFDIHPGPVPGAVVKATGPLHIIERDTSAHMIPREGARVRRKRKRLKLADGNVRRRVNHPGTSGKHPFEKAVNASQAATLKAMRAPYTKALAKQFGR